MQQQQSHSNPLCMCQAERFGQEAFSHWEHKQKASSHKVDKCSHIRSCFFTAGNKMKLSDLSSVAHRMAILLLPLRCTLSVISLA